MATDRTALPVKLKLLEENLKAMGKIALAFSGGVDSSFLLFKAICLLGAENTLAVTVSSVLHPGAETAEAALIAGQLGAEQLLLPLDLLRVAEVAENSAERCYQCKKTIFKALIDAVGSRDFCIVVDGTNADDSVGYRPGLRALKELKVRSPLQEAGLGKAEIRQLAKEAGLQVWNKPAVPCLATRFPVGTRITKNDLTKVEEAEAYLRELQLEGNLRVRVHGDLVRVEADPAKIGELLDLREKIGLRFRALGFKYLTVDLDGYRTGSMENPLCSKD